MGTSLLSRAADLEAFEADPVGRFHGASSWMHWCASPSFWGVLLWGRPGREDALALIRSLRLELAAGARPHVSLVDVSRLSSVDLSAFELLNAYVSEQHRALSEKVSRLALVRPEGMAGAVTAGFYEVLEAPYPVKLFDTAANAVGWLAEAPGAALLPSLAEAHAGLTSRPPIVTQLRAKLRADLEMGSKEAARALAVSERTLQRRLSEANTSFQAELRAVRIESAKAMMRDSDASLTRIALDCGFRSLQNFSAVFRREEGEAPSAWRHKAIGAQP